MSLREREREAMQKAVCEHATTQSQAAPYPACPSNGITQSIMHVFTVFLSVGLNGLKTLIILAVQLAITGHSYPHTNITCSGL